MYAVASILLPLVISLASSAFVAPRDECYNITTSSTYTSSLLSKASYIFSNSTFTQQCQVAITSWFTTTVTIAPPVGYLSSSAPSSTFTPYPSKKALLAIKRTAIPTTKPASNMSSTTTSANVQSLLSEFASMYSVLTQYEYNATANPSTATASDSFNSSAFNIPTPTSYSNSTATNATLAPSTCALPCQNCTTVFCYATKTIITKTPSPSSMATLPPIIVGNTTYTPTGTYYIIDNSTLSPGGVAILVANSTFLSLSPSGTQLVIAPLSSTSGGPGPSTYDLSPAPVSSPPAITPTPTNMSTSTSPKAGTAAEVAATTITGPYNLPVVILPSEPIVIAGTTITPGASAVTVGQTPVSLAPSSDFLVVGGSTITFVKNTITAAKTSTATTATSQQGQVGSMIWSGIGGTEPGSSATGPKTTPSASVTLTNGNATYIGQVFTGAGTSLSGNPGLSLWLGLGLGLGFATGWSIVLTIAMSILISTASSSMWALEAGMRTQS